MKRLILALLVSLLALAVPNPTSGQCGSCHTGTGGCTNCHSLPALSGTAHQSLTSATLTVVNTWSGGGGGMGRGRAMSPACVCHAVLHFDRQTPGLVYVEEYLPSVNPPYVSPTASFTQNKLQYNCASGGCPPNLQKLYNSLYNAGYFTGKRGDRYVVVVGLWDWYVKDLITPLPGSSISRVSNVDPSLVGAYGSIADSSWKSCFNCHFVYANAPTTSLPDTAYVQHPDVCQPCHGQSTFQSTTIGGANRMVWTHNVLSYKVNGADAIWSNCGVCHSAIKNVVSTSVHYNVGCKCHSVVHIGYNYNGWLAGLYTFVGSTGGATPPFETVPSIARLARAYTPRNASKVLGYLVGNITSASAGGRNVEVGLWDAYSKDYLSTLFYIGTPIGKYGLGPERVWTACFNCHFTAIDPSKAADPHAIGWRLGVENKWDISTTPYEIGAESGGGGAGYVKFYAGLLLVFSLLGGGLVWLRKK